MINLEEFNVPIMSDEGLQQVMKSYDLLYTTKASLSFEAQDYIVNRIKLATTKDVNSHEECSLSIKTKYSISIILNLLKAIKEDISIYGYDNYIDRIRKQCRESDIINCLNYDEIINALNFPQDKIYMYIENGKLNELPKLIQYLYNTNKFGVDYNGKASRLPYVLSKDIPVENDNKKIFRIYLNNPIDEKGLVFYNLFVSKLIEKRIPYLNKFNYHKEKERKDKSIFYFSTDYLYDVTSILEDINAEFPYLTQSFGSPPISCANNGYYGISHSGRSLAVDRTYNMYFNDITYIAYFIYFCKQFVLNGSIFFRLSDEEKNIIYKYAKGTLNEEVFNNIKTLPFPFSSDSRIIRDIIKKYSKLFNRSVDINVYRNILKQVVSIRMYGDLEHLDIPICYNESFYDALEPYNKAY